MRTAEPLHQIPSIYLALERALDVGNWPSASVADIGPARKLSGDKLPDTAELASLSVIRQLAQALVGQLS